MPVHVTGPRQDHPSNAFVLNVTSRSDVWMGKMLSPFYLGPVPLYWGLSAQNVENAWQFSKVYSEHQIRNVVAPQWWRWALRGWGDTRAHRYPMGKGKRPLFSLWKGEHLGYISARKRIYIPLYAHCVRQTQTGEIWRWLQKTCSEQDVWLWDFDGYNYKSEGLSLLDVVDNPNRTMGHGHVLSMMLEAPELVADLEDPWS